MNRSPGANIWRLIEMSIASIRRFCTALSQLVCVPSYKNENRSTFLYRLVTPRDRRRIRTARTDPPLFTMAVCGIAVFMLACVAGCGQSTETTDVTAEDEQPHGLRLVDLEGTIVDPLKQVNSRAHVFLFTRTDCPISNRYAPEVRRLCELFQGQGVEFCLVYPDPQQTAEEVRRHVDEYGYPCGTLRDPQHDLVKLTGAQITPEAAVFDSTRQMVYLGRIDDRYVDFGKARAEATQHDLQEALQAVVEGKPVPNPRTKSVGCYIADLK